MQLPIRELLIHPFIYWVILILLCRCYYLVISCGNNFLKNLSQSPTLVCLNLQLSNLQYLTLMCLVMLIQVHQSMINKQRTLIPELFYWRFCCLKSFNVVFTCCSDRLSCHQEWSQEMATETKMLLSLDCCRIYLWMDWNPSG